MDIENMTKRTKKKHSEFFSETDKYRHLTQKYCKGVGIDIGSQGCPVVPWAFNIDLPHEEFAFYNSNNIPKGPIQICCRAEKLWMIEVGSLDFVYSSHLLEDFVDWMPILQEWVSKLKKGGKLIILVPDKEKWNAAISQGQPPNCQHKHESSLGELSTYAPALGLKIIEERYTDEVENDYSILFVAERI